MSNVNYNTKEIIVNYNRIFLLSDVHFGVRGNSFEWLENQLNFFKQYYIPFINKNKKPGDILVILGDWFDNRQLLDIYVMNSAMEILEELSSILPCYHIIGNHDIYKKIETDINSITPFKNNITIIKEPTILTNNKTSILALPWVGSKDIEEQWIINNETDYIFMHSDISGFKYDNGKEITKGINVNKIKTKRLFSGHIHKRQEQEKYIYIGSPYHTKRSDIGNEKGLYIFEPSNNTYEFHKNKYSPIFQRIQLEHILNLTVEETSKILNNNYTDIIVPSKWVNKFNLTKFIDSLNDCKYKKIEAEVEKKSVDDISNVLDDIDVRDIPTVLESAISNLKISKDELHNVKMLNKKYYEKASKGDEITLK